MKRVLLAAATAIMVLASVTWMVTWAGQNKKEVVGLTPEHVRWFTPPYYKDGRQRAQLLGDSNQGGAWVDRVKIPVGGRVLAHTRTWYLGEGKTFDPAKLKGYPAGSFIVIPPGVPHFVAAKDGAVIVQVSGVGKFVTDYLEK
ncbi:MAG: hypothetical protein DME84_01120 [Verrucomicrobia bacterium]|nr:MAG: hypothetical protein DME84_01120 [Verrucomicrobiota bacterium]